MVLDTETTGLDHENGHRIVEIGAIELENHVPTGNQLHYYLNPERLSDLKAEQIHGLTHEFLINQPKFIDIVDDFTNFIDNSKLIIHNASFDIGFINAELKRCNMTQLDDSVVIDTLGLAKKKFLGQSVSLDSLCKRYNIDISDRKVHGALKDAKLLASVYLELIGGKQSKLQFYNISQNPSQSEENNSINIEDYYKNLELKKSKIIDIDVKDYKLHNEAIKKIPNNIWDRIDN